LNVPVGERRDGGSIIKCVRPESIKDEQYDVFHAGGCTGGGGKNIGSERYIPVRGCIDGFILSGRWGEQYGQ
jgi:hypothetical protein